MTTLILQTAGAALGGFVGGPLGAAFGRSLGQALGQSIDTSLFGSSSGATRDGPRLSELAGIASTEGAPIPRVYGRVRLGGTVIWATRFQEHVERRDSGGKGGGGSTSTTRTYSYTANIAIGLCEGPIAFVRRIWANGKLIDQSGLTIRCYQGTEDQDPDPLIIAKEGVANAPAYRGLAYLVFEALPLDDFGNRVPQFSFEIVRSVDGPRQGIRSINLIPGAGEFVYDPKSITTSDLTGTTRHLNRHDLSGESDFIASMDRLQALCPALSTVQLVISWFGDDLRADHCLIAPRVEAKMVPTVETEWHVSGLTRADARVVTYIDGKAAYGGTPSDASILRAIKDLKSRGLKVILYPFVMMDIDAASLLPDPHDLNGTQPAFPWRGRITCNPAPGLSGSPHGTSRAKDQINHFFGQARSSHFQSRDETIIYQGPTEWSWRRMILHYAMLATLAGGVDGFILGSELRDLTLVESEAGQHPAVDAFIALAQEVKALLGPSCLLTYAADWTEYGARVMPSGDIRFPLDPLWASPSIDAIGIDAYFPLSDWRDGLTHADATLARSPSDPEYLRSRLTAGEAFEWYYSNDDDRKAGHRQPITDGAYQKPWMFRAKDLKSWWQNFHYERRGSVEQAQPTGWMPESKPIWLTEFGCPAVDRGSNGPNSFPDPKSSENALPPFSRGGRDDLIQSRVIGAYQSRFDPQAEGFDESDNPKSHRDGRRMIDPASMALWAYDARPFPAFPLMESSWSDAANYSTGHWLNGRIEACPLDHLVRAILADFSIDDCEVSVDGFLDGYVIASPSSARSALEPLSSLFRFDCLATDRLKFTSIDGRGGIDLGFDDCIPNKADAYVSVKRAQANELPCEVRLGFSDGDADYRSALVSSRRLAVASRRELTSDPMIVTHRAEAKRLADRLLHELWAQRDRATLSLRPGLIALDIGDIIRFDQLGHRGAWRIDRISDRGIARDIEAHSLSLDMLDVSTRHVPQRTLSAPSLAGRPAYAVIDLPVIKGDAPILQSLGASVAPWPGALTVWRSSDGVMWAFFGSITRPARLGVTQTDLLGGPTSCWDLANTVSVTFGSGVESSPLSSPGDDAALSGDAVIAIEGADKQWEVIGFARAELIGPSTWRLSRLLRGLGSSDTRSKMTVSAGARALILDEALLPLATGIEDVGKHFYWRITAQGVDYMHPTALAFETTIGTQALIPLSPDHARAKRTPSGILIDFFRRGRVRADSWVPPDIPLDQIRESYEIEIMNGPIVVRTLSSDTTEILYSSDFERADFTNPLKRISVVIYQVGDGVGRGSPGRFTLAIQ